MKKIMVICCVLISGLAALSADATHPLAFLYGDWEGEGKTSGLVASIRHTWKSALNGQYTTLQLHNRMTGEDGQSFVFEGTGYYQAANENALTGVWIDSQGNILPLHATIDDLTLVVIWGNEGSKLGRSVYRLLPGGELETVNSIKGQADEWEEFGRAVLKRK